MKLKTRMDILMRSFEVAKKNGYDYFAILVKVGDSEPEIIINHKDNLESKKKYYYEAYDENLRLKSAKDININIVNYIFASNLGDLFFDLSNILDEVN